MSHLALHRSPRVCGRRWLLAIALVVAVLLEHRFAWAAPITTLVAAGSAWRYLDTGANLGGGWVSPAFDDSNWLEGRAQLGFGEGDEATEVSFGPDPDFKYVTTYFRRTLMVSNATSLTGLELGVLRDDGVVVYVNGVEVFRNNMPAGPLGYLTLALTNVHGPAESVFYAAEVPSGLLRDGLNVVAAEVHQAGNDSIDLSFDLQLTGVNAYPLNRGPYLQLGTPTSMGVLWRTAIPTDSEVRYGASPGALTGSVTIAQAVLDHEVRLTGLEPGTKYYYAAGPVDISLAEGPEYYFHTAPAGPAATRVWIIGDAGTQTAGQRDVRDAYYQFAGGRHTDVWLMLGDNAYGSGTDPEYQAAVFNVYQKLLRTSSVWPTIGNHDAYSGVGGFGDFPYLHIFSLPTQGEAGGVPSGTERYYSFNHGGVHFICLDSMTVDRSAQGPMALWLQQDLAANTNLWTIAYWHHPAYTKGSHNSDVETELIEMRENIVPILESHGVDLVFAGHSHSYERSYLIDGHYGTTGTWSEGMKKNGGSGRENGSGAYYKSTIGSGSHEGAVYVVAGSSGWVTPDYGLDHPAMYLSLRNLGSVVLDIVGTRCDVKFLRENGVVADYFTLRKGQGPGGLKLAYIYDNDYLFLSWPTVAGKSYCLEQATNPGQATWQALSDSQLGDGSDLSWEIHVPSGPPKAYYRVRVFDD
jgi:hypothetical protein